MAKNMVAIEKRQEIVSARSLKLAKRPLNFFSIIIFLSWFGFQNLRGLAKDFGGTAR